jgi:CRISPR/Cas system-associated exonuclease Cas4 (RecB family)
VEKTADGEYIIADFKTGWKIKHVEDDIHTCLQVVVYAYLMEQMGLPISRCEYRYPRDSKKVSCRYDEAMKQQLNEKLLEFKNALLSGEFPATASDDACKYCTLGNICHQNLHEEEAL